LGGGEEDLEWNHSLEYSRWDHFLGKSSCVKRVVCNIEEQEENMEASCICILVMEYGWAFLNVFN
jgi:hypothetical protein